MNRKRTYWKVIGLILAIVLSFVLIWHYSLNISIKNVQLSSPDNKAFQEEISIELDKPASLYVKYWPEGSSEKFKTVKSPNGLKHNVQLLLLETNTIYNYQIIIDRFINVKSGVLSFKTREQSPWLDFHWVNNGGPFNKEAFGDGLLMICYARMPGFIAMVDVNGKVKWHWQVDDIGVRAATLTPRGTILAMLRPPNKDEIDDKPKEHRRIIEEIQKPMRRGKVGFAGGTALVEIDLTGKTLWRLEMKGKVENDLIHHDIRMDEKNQIHTLYRAIKLLNNQKNALAAPDTLFGDGIVVLDSLGKEIWKWSVWDMWDTEKDTLLDEFGYDRFHMNALNFDSDGNYLVSVAMEDQIWKINSKTGKLMWKLGRNGDFKMDTTCYFSFQHSVNLNLDGDYMLFDNNLFREVSRSLSFRLDTTEMTATTIINAPLPTEKYTSRMGNGYLLYNGNLLQTSAKTGSVLITDKTGKILWELDSPFVPYRVEYIPANIWDNYFIKD
jgi:arylsulfate sulfotransferase